MTFNSSTDEETEAFILKFRRLVKHREKVAGKEKADLTREIDRMRNDFAAWQGEDSLYEMAFGEPVE